MQPVTLADFKTPGAELGGVHYLRNVEDANALLEAIKACKAAGGKARGVGLGGWVCLSGVWGVARWGDRGVAAARLDSAGRAVCTVLALC